MDEFFVVYLTAMHIELNQFREFVLDSGLVTRKDFDAAVAEAAKTGKNLADIFVSQGLIVADDLRKINAHILGIPFVDLRNEKIDPNVLSLIPEPVARAHNIVAFRQNNEGLEVAMLDTEDLASIDFIKKKVGARILPRLTDTESMRAVLLQYQKSLKAEFGDLIREEAENLKGLPVVAGDVVGTELKKLTESVPVVRIVDALLKHAVLQSASDIHIEPMEKEVLVRYRIDGLLRDAMVLPKHAGPSITARIKVLSSLKLDEKRLPQDGRFKVEISGQKVSLRVSVLPTYFGEKTVMRLLPEGGGGFTLESLCFHGEGLEKIHKATKLTTGMILTTGPTGSGKTTTLYTVLDILNTPDVNISTIEDPVEYQMPRINQTQVKPDIGFTFGSGLRALVRQDPDIIMVGEIRDNETASLAVNAALTGHLVLSTLHTNSAAGAIPRLLDMKVEPFLMVSTLSVIVAQRLVRKLCETKEQYFLSAAELDKLGQIVDLNRILTALKAENIVDKGTSWKDIPFYKPKLSPDCEDGYSSRVGIHEVLSVTPTIKELILRGAPASAIEEQAKKEGMLTMYQDGLLKVLSGLTTLDEVLRETTNK